MIGRAELLEGLYVFKVVSSSTFAAASPSSIVSSLCSFYSSCMNKTPFDIWHARLGHLSDQRLSVLRHHLSLPDCRFPFVANCSICPLAKERRLSFTFVNDMCSAAFDMIHCDIWGPFHAPTHLGHKYFLSIVDDFTRFTWIHLLKSKSETSLLLQKFITCVETQFGVVVKCL